MAQDVYLDGSGHLASNTGVLDLGALAGGEVIEADRSVTWHDNWDRWTEVPVNTPGDSTPVYTVDDGVGIASSGDPSAGGAEDRRLFMLDGVDGVEDCEVYLDWEVTGGGSQCGLAVRVAHNGDNWEAVTAWQNTVFGASGLLLYGVWEFDGTTLLNTNKQVDELGGFKSAVASVTGDGTTATVHTVLPHLVAAGHIVDFDDVGSLGQETVAAVIDDTTFTVADTTAGSWTGGTYRWVITPTRSHCALRVVGDQMTAKRWLPDQDEPAWDDPDKALTITLPATLTQSGGPPPARGGVGFFVNHLGAAAQGRTVRVNDFRFVDLDVVRARPGRAVDDSPSHADVGEATARLDRLANPTNPGVSWVGDPVAYTTSQALTNGTLYLGKVPIDRQRLASLLHWWVTGAAVTPTSGQNWVGIYSSTGTRLAQTGVDATVTSTGLKSTSIGPVTVDPPHVWVALLFNASTPPSTPRASGTPTGTIASAVASVGMPAALLRFATAGTSLTALPSTVTPASLTAGTLTAPWAAVS